MELAIATDFAGEFERNEDVKLCIDQIAAAGFTHMHWCFEWDGEYIYAHAEMEQIREWMEENGLKAKSLHASKGSSRKIESRSFGHYRKDYTSDVEANRIAGVELVKNRVELAHVLGATEIVLHMYLPHEDFINNPSYKEVFYTQVEKSLDELMPYCLERGVRICLENLFEAPGEMQIEQFSRLFAKYPAEFLGLCLDTGHANLVWGDAFIEKLVEPFKDRLYSIHIHDNNGWGNKEGCGDAHKLPGTCSIDWKRLMSVLRTSAYEMPLTLEVGQDAREDRMTFLKEAIKSGEWLYSL